MCVPFGTRDGSQFWQCTHDTVCYVMRQCCHDVMSYINNFLGFGTPSITHASLDTLRDVKHHLGLTIRDKKLFHPTTQAVCLGVLIDTMKGIVSIPTEKLDNVSRKINAFTLKNHSPKMNSSPYWVTYYMSINVLKTWAKCISR